MFKKNNSRKDAKPQRTAFDSPLRLCAFAREKYLFFRHAERSKKINSRKAAKTQRFYLR